MALTQTPNATKLVNAGAAGTYGPFDSVQALHTIVAMGDFTTATLKIQLPDETYTDVDSEGNKLLEFSAPGADNITMAPGVKYAIVVVGGTSTTVWSYQGRVERSS